MDFSDVQWLEVDGLKVRYLKGPERTGVPLFLTSPWPESLFAFRKIWDRLTAQTSVVAVDLPGFGQSEGRIDVLSPSGMGAILPQIMHALGLTRVHGVGPDDLEAAQNLAIRPCLNTVEQLARWKEIAPDRLCDVMIDTGINRLGLRPTEIDALQGLTIDTLHSHLACADEDDPLNAMQLERFRAVASAVPAERYSFANSAGICLGRDYSFDLVRPGLALYGGVPRAEAEGNIRQVARVEAQVAQRRTIPEGESCGYGATFIAKETTEAAILNIGYADGYLRGFSSHGSAFAGECALPVLGRVSMDLLAVGCDAAPGLKEGDWVEIDYDLPSASKQSGLSQYELLTCLGERFERRWI